MLQRIWPRAMCIVYRTRRAWEVMCHEDKQEVGRRKQGPGVVVEGA